METSIINILLCVGEMCDLGSMDTIVNANHGLPPCLYGERVPHLDTHH